MRIRKQPSQILVTIYQLPHEEEAKPRLQVRQLLGASETGDVLPPHALQAQAAAVAAAAAKANVMAHIQSRGDVGTVFGEWLGESGSNNWVEGFAFNAPEGVAAADFTYQAVLGRGWLSPWVEAGQYCGSRGMALPLLGFRIRLQGALAEAFELSASASFIDGSACGPVGSDATCEGEKLAPLEAMTVSLAARARKPPRAKR